MTVIARYLGRLLVLQIAIVLVVLCSLALAFDLLEEADQVLNATGGDAFAVVKYALLRLPEITAMMLPISTLIGAMVAFGLLMRHRELVPIWNSGVSVFDLIKAVAPVGLVLCALQFGLIDRVVPVTVRSLYDWGIADFRNERADVGQTTSATWMASGGDIVRLPVVAGDKTPARFEDVLIVRRDARGLVSETLRAEAAEPRKDGFRLLSVTRTVVDPPATEWLPEYIWHGRVDVDDLALVSRTMRELTIDEIAALIAREGYGQTPTTLYRTWFQYRLASSLAAMGMLFLVVALSQRYQRTGGFTRLMLMGAICGFSFFVFDGVALALGEAGLVPPVASAWSPPLALAALVWWLVLRREG